VSNTSSLEQRLARREAAEAIKQLKAAYFHACDNNQPEVVRGCFFVGRIDLRYGRIGDFTDREKVVPFFFELGCQEHIAEMPHGQNPRIVLLDADYANGVWGLYYYLIDTRRQAAPLELDDPGKQAGLQVAE